MMSPEPLALVCVVIVAFEIGHTQLCWIHPEQVNHMATVVTSGSQRDVRHPAGMLLCARNDKYCKRASAAQAVPP